MSTSKTRSGWCLIPIEYGCISSICPFPKRAPYNREVTDKNYLLILIDLEWSNRVYSSRLVLHILSCCGLEISISVSHSCSPGFNFFPHCFSHLYSALQRLIIVAEHVSSFREDQQCLYYCQRDVDGGTGGVNGVRYGRSWSTKHQTFRHNTYQADLCYYAPWNQ